MPGRCQLKVDYSSRRLLSGGLGRPMTGMQRLESATKITIMGTVSAHRVVLVPEPSVDGDRALSTGVATEEVFLIIQFCPSLWRLRPSAIAYSRARLRRLVSVE